MTDLFGFIKNIVQYEFNILSFHRNLDFAKGWITLINEGTIMYIIDVDAPIMYIIIRTTMMHKKLLLHQTKKITERK